MLKLQLQKRRIDETIFDLCPFPELKQLMAGFLPQVFHWTSFKGEQNTRLQKNKYMKAQDDEGTFLIFLSWSSRSEEQKTAPRKPAPTNNGDPGGNKIAFALKSNSHWWFMKQNITMANTDEVVVKQYISQEHLGLETECRRAPRRFFSLQIVWQFLFLKKYKF